MAVPVNGSVLRRGNNWDNEPGVIVVDQLYEVRISRNNEQLINDFFTEVDRVISNLAYERVEKIVLEARWQFERPDVCLDFLKFWRNGSWQFKIYERRHYPMSADSFEEISEEDLKQIIAGIRKPVTKHISSMNSRFNADLGE